MSRPQHANQIAGRRAGVGQIFVHHAVTKSIAKHPILDARVFGFGQSLDDMNTTPRPVMAEGYQSYLDRFPDGAHVEIVKKRYEYCRNNR